MMNSAMQLTGEAPLSTTDHDDTTDPEVPAARVAAELPTDFVWGAATSAYRW